VTLDGLVDLADPNFPAIRSTIMITAFVVAYLIDRDGDPFNITLLAALLILALDPFALFGVGFQLSFVGVLTIFYAYRCLPPVSTDDTHEGRSRRSVTRFKRWLRDGVVVSVFASLGTAPLVLYHFERLPCIAPLANIIVAPFASVAVPSAIVVGIWLVWPWLLPAGRGHLLVTFLDVGHGDASFIRFPHGTTMLIDGGGSYRDDIDIGARVVAPFLRHTRVRCLDYLVATHPHPDHAKGLGFILGDFRVGQFWDNGAPLRSEWYSALRGVAVRRGIYRDVMAEGYTAAVIDGVHLTLLHPSATFQPPTKRRGGGDEVSENNRSLVLRLTYGAVSVLFTGDIEQEAERFLLQAGHDLRSTIVKVPHHGSRSSSSEPFVRAVDPRLAVFSVPRDGRFGHPHPAVVERYKAAGASIWRTDDHGAVTVRTDGHSVWVVPAIGEPAVLDAPATGPLAETRLPPAVAPRE
jgi:ComEC/Rec2-related protein